MGSLDLDVSGICWTHQQDGFSFWDINDKILEIWNLFHDGRASKTAFSWHEEPIGTWSEPKFCKMSVPKRPFEWDCQKEHRSNHIGVETQWTLLGQPFWCRFCYETWKLMGKHVQIGSYIRYAWESWDRFSALQSYPWHLKRGWTTEAVPSLSPFSMMFLIDMTDATSSHGSLGMSCRIAI